jgi:hypothetical protein
VLKHCPVLKGSHDVTSPDGIAVPRWVCEDPQRKAVVSDITTVGLDLAKNVFQVHGALLHKSADGRTSLGSGQTCPATFVTGMPSAVKWFRTATRTWNSDVATEI